MVGMLAAGGGFDQIGRKHSRTWGDPADPAVIGRLSQLGRWPPAVTQGLRGTTFGRIGGRPMGMYTTVANTDQWMAQFGIDIEDIDQYELVRRGSAGRPGASPRRPGCGWRSTPAGVHYDGEKLTPELLERQIGVYYAVRELADEWNLDFCGIKGQPEMTNNWCTMDIAEAFLNDPYDWDGPKDTLVCSTESDMDAALTMQILKGLSGHAGAVRRRAALRGRPRRLGPVQLRPARDLVRRPQRRPGARTWPACTCTPRCCTSRPAARRCTTSRPRAR